MQAYINGKHVAIPTAIVASRLHPAASASFVRQHVGNASTYSVRSNERRILCLLYTAMEENTIYVSRGYGVETQYGNEFRMHDFHFITDNPWKGQEKEIDITFKIRHTPDFTKGKLIQDGLLYTSRCV